MESASDAATFFEKLEKHIPLLKGKDPNPLSSLQRKNLVAWKTLINSGSANGNSRARRTVRRRALDFASKVKKITNFETLFLSLVVYAISSLPKISYPEFYEELQGWSQKIHFSDSLKMKASQLWSNPYHQDLDPGSPIRTVVSSAPHPPPRTQLVQNANSEIDVHHRVSSNIYNNRTESHFGSHTDGGDNEGAVPSENRQGLEMAFLVPPELLDKFYALHKASMSSKQHSAILTIPTQDRVGSLILSIPRTEAVVEGDMHNLPVIFNSSSPFA